MILLAEPLATVAVFVVGSVLGSFLNVCILRLPLGESVVRPRSRCPGCGRQLRWYENVPIVSWLVLRGRCATCRARISWRYPAVETLSGLLLLGLWRLYGATPAFWVAAPFALALVVLFFTDYDHQLLPDAITLTGVVAGLAVSPLNPFLGEGAWRRVLASCLGAALGAGGLWLVGAVYSRLRHVDAMGLGDVKMMGMVGAFSGPKGVLVTLFAASLVGAAFGLAMIPLRGKTLKDALPFGCFLAPAALLALLVGQAALDGYMRYIRQIGGGW
jgi:leader peptidase (prepilin peptidase)/N-methyltransferase